MKENLVLEFWDRGHLIKAFQFSVYFFTVDKRVYYYFIFSFILVTLTVKIVFRSLPVHIGFFNEIFFGRSLSVI